MEMENGRINTTDRYLTLAQGLKVGGKEEKN